MIKALFLVPLLLMLCSCEQAVDQPTDISNEPDWTLMGFSKVDSLNPILRPQANQIFTCPLSQSSLAWEAKNVLNPAAVVKDDQIYLMYRAQDENMTSRLGLAVSNDGLHFQKQPQPVFFPQADSMQVYEWPGGVEDPRIVESEEGQYILTYTAYDGNTARLCLATSKDLITWTKHGLVLNQQKYRDTWSKAGAIVCRREGQRLIATKLQGKYWMYFGDTDIFMATSHDLIHWQVLENEENGKMVSVLNPRPGRFDSRLVEPGPYALLTEAGILLIYNGSNAANLNDPELPKFTYAAGQALFDKQQPYKLLDRTENYFIHPDKPYEKVGEVNEVCFVEGLVYFKNAWYLYYGTADSKIAVAVNYP
ncbi:MAG: glycoside hydrolase family 130 protein [Cyclobacteriaceae bacterium]|nr:glycoside hydrolase family 130 protein [Cyclobacteriaceae bacterium]